MANYNTSFIVNAADLAKILEQIKIAELHAAGGNLVEIIGQDAALLPMGLRTVDGSFNHLLPGQSLVGAADQVFPRLLEPTYVNEQDGDTMPLGPPGAPVVTNTNYDPTITTSSNPAGVNVHSVADADPRIISNLIVDQTLNNRSALVSALLVLSGGANGGDIVAATAQADEILAARDAVANSGAKHTAYADADAAAATVQTKIGIAAAELAAFRAGLNDDTLDGADVANVTTAADAVHDAALAQIDVVNALLSNAGVAAGDVTAAQTLLSTLNALDTALSPYATGSLLNPLADGLSFSEFNALATAQTSAAAAAVAATTNHAALTSAEQSSSPAGLAVALENVITDAGLEISPDGSILIENRSADIGLSPANSAWMTFFGQFFDHGLDLVTKGGNGKIYIPLQPDDPLYVVGGSSNFMVLTRTTPFDANGNPSPTGTESQNTTTPFVDQNQTYTSSASHQVFLREYKFVADSADLGTDPDVVNSGHLLNNANGGIATWKDVKTQAAEKLGLTLTDADVLDVPKLAVDAYGNFIAGAHGFAQVYINVSIVTTTPPPVGAPPGTPPTITVVSLGDTLVEGVAGGLDMRAFPPGFVPVPLPPGSVYQVGPAGTGHAFLNDIAHTAEPVIIGGVLQPDGNDVINAPDFILPNDGQGHNFQYDNELLDAHFMTGDGRGNENIGLSAVHNIFHSEHNRLVEANKDTLIATGDVNVVNQWLAAGPGGVSDRQTITQLELDAINGMADPVAKAAAIDALNWDGSRLFQAARFVTEMQYQHLVFEEFARRVQPNVDPFVFTNSADLDPAIIAEFAHTVYRFGHSMLTDTVDRLDNNLNVVGDADPLEPGDQQVGLIEAFLNPQLFTASAGSPSPVSDETATGALIRGMSRQVGNEIDEFVVEALRNNLLGLPLDLPTLNIARGRDAGVPTLNDARAQIYAMSGAADVRPYVSWTDFAQNIKHPLSVINFIAAYGTHEAITTAATIEDKRAAATLLVLGDGDSDGSVTIGGHTYTDDERLAFLNGSDAYTGGAAAAGKLGGLNAIDLWIGGLAEKINEFGGQLGSTFNFVFEYQLEHLQNGDRFYYLSRTQGMNLLNLLEPNTFTDLVMRNTDLGDIHSTHLPANLMSVDDMILELDKEVRQENYSGVAARDGTDPLDRRLLDPTKADAFEQAINPKVFRQEGTARMDGLAPVLDAEGKQIYDGGILKFSGGEHVVLGGTEGNDKLYGDRGIDTLWGDAGDDYLNAGMESDQVYGGDGDDIIEDPFGDNFLRGDGGDDVIVSDQGLTLMFGGEGQDFIMGGTDAKEVFAGPGNDFVLGGTAPDGLMGNEGDDWIEGGEGFDGLSGENSDLFFNSPIIGHDILNGQGNDTDYDGESGDDIMVQGAGIQRNNGMLGFDWSIQKGDENDGLIDLGISRFLTQQALTLRDRNDSVEGASGWKHNDTLIGTTSPTGAVGDPVGGVVGAPTTDSMLLSQNVRLISGMAEFLALTPGALRGQTVDPTNTNFASLANDTTVFDPQNGGDILLGGGGSDLLIGKAGNDLMDGDRWLNVKISVHESKTATGPAGAVLFSVDSLTSVVSGSTNPAFNGKQLADLMRTGKINPGQLEAVREIITDGAVAADQDVALFFGSRADFSITRNANGTITVVDNVVAPVLDATGARIPLMDDEGTDTLSNIEIARFTNYDANGIPTGTFTDVSLAPPSGFVSITGTTNQLTADPSGIIDLNGILPGTLAYQWQSSASGTGGWTTVSGVSASPTFTVPNGSLDFYRVVVSYTDGAGINESIPSIMTARVGTNGADILNGTDDPNLLIGLGGSDNLDGGAGNDVLVGGANNDILNGGAGNDTFTYAIGDGADAIDGAADNDTLAITGTGNNDTLDVIYDGTAITQFEGGTLTNIETITANLAGGNGDTLSYAGTTVGITVNLALPSASGFTSIANIENAVGGSGADTFIGGTGNNTFTGGAGNDTYTVNDTGDQVSEANGTAGGVDTVNSSATFTISDADVENLTLIGIANINGTGNGSANVLTGNSGNNVLTGGGGNDTVSGGDGNDTFNYTIGDGADSINGGNNNDTLAITGNNGTDTLDVIYNGAAITTFEGGTLTAVESITANLGGNTDTLSYAGTTAGVSVNLATGTASGFSSISNIENAVGGSGADTFTGGTGTNVFTGGDGSDTFNVNDAADQVVEANGTAGGIDLVNSSVTYTISDSDVENLTLTGNGNINGTGNASANVLTGNTGNNILTGGAGNDAVNGGAGTADVAAFSLAALNYAFGSDISGNIIVTANSGTDGTDTLSGIETLRFGGTDFAVVSGNGVANTLTGGAASDAIFGFGGNDTINGGTGNDLIVAGDGDDTITWNFTGATPGGRDFIDGGANATATGDAVQITGDGSVGETFRIYSRSAWLLVGGNSAANLNANTEIVITRNGTNNASIVTELDNIEEIRLNSLAVGANGGSNVLVIGSFAGTSLNFNTITISGTSGNDTVDISQLTSPHRIVFTSNGGADSVIGARAQDILNETINGTAADNAITAGNGNDTVYGLGGNDKFVASLLATGHDGNDSYDGGDGADTYDLSVTTANANVNLAAGTSSSTQTGADKLVSIENIMGGRGSDTITGNAGANVLSGNAGNDKIYGGAGADTISGGDGQDIINGGAGNDSLRGGVGMDVFAFQAGFGNDRIADFDADPSGGQDHIDISALGITAANFDMHVFAFDYLGGSLIVVDNFNQSIILDNVKASSVTVDDFTLALS